MNYAQHKKIYKYIYMKFLVKEFVVFLKDKKIIEGSIMFAIGNMLRTLMVELNSKVIAPLSKGDIKRVRKQRISSYIFLISQIVISSYIFFLLWRAVTFSYDKIIGLSDRFDFL